MTLSTVHGRSLPKESSRKMDSPPKVYLHTFPPLPHVYSMSPFSLKVESWLRLHGIDYECVYCMECGRQLLTLCNLQPDANPQSLTLILSLQYGHRFGPKNQIPFVLWSVTRCTVGTMHSMQCECACSGASGSVRCASTAGDCRLQRHHRTPHNALRCLRRHQTAHAGAARHRARRHAHGRGASGTDRVLLPLRQACTCSTHGHMHKHTCTCVCVPQRA